MAALCCCCSLLVPPVRLLPPLWPPPARSSAPPPALLAALPLWALPPELSSPPPPVATHTQTDTAGSWSSGQVGGGGVKHRHDRQAHTDTKHGGEGGGALQSAQLSSQAGGVTNRMLLER